MKLSEALTAMLALTNMLISGAECHTKLRNIQYLDQGHVTTLPLRDVTAGITHVIMAFANSSLFIGDTKGPYKPFKPVSEVRAMFDEGSKIGVAIGGWGDTAGFSTGAATENSRTEYANNVKAMLDEHGFEFLDCDWEYPAGNGEDHKQNPNSGKVNEIITFPLLLQKIKDTISPKELSIAVPGKEVDMIAYTPEQSPKIAAAVDFVNVMTYDLINRRDHATRHHTGLVDSLQTIDKYISLGFPASKLNLGFALYAKYFKTADGEDCSGRPIGCPIALAEGPQGEDLGTSGAVTFETANVNPPPPPPSNPTVSPDGTCGTGTAFKCGPGQCCSQAGYCGSTTAHCSAGCQPAFGTCAAAARAGPSTAESFRAALAHGVTDDAAGGQWYWHREAGLFWTWDTPALMRRKFTDIVAARGLGGVFAWSLGEDSAGWTRVRALRDGVRAIEAAAAVGKV